MVFVDRQAGEEAWKQTAASLQPSSTSGHFVYDKAQMHAIAQKWTELALHYASSARNAIWMGSVTGPGDEYASKGHAVDANFSGSAYSDSINACREYCNAQVAKYRQVLGEVANADDESHRKLEQQTSPLDGGI
jgi:uncharacterized membrane protein